MTLAYTNEKCSKADHTARDVFLTALDDPEFKLKVRGKEPRDLNAAVKLAQRFEVFKLAVESSNSKLKMNRNVVDCLELEQKFDEKSKSMKTNSINTFLMRQNKRD